MASALLARVLEVPIMKTDRESAMKRLSIAETRRYRCIVTRALKLREKHPDMPIKEATDQAREAYDNRRKTV